MYCSAALTVLLACGAPHCCVCWRTYQLMKPSLGAAAWIYVKLHLASIYLPAIEIHLWNPTKQWEPLPGHGDTPAFVSSRLRSNFRLMLFYFKFATFFFLKNGGFWKESCFKYRYYQDLKTFCKHFRDHHPHGFGWSRMLKALPVDTMLPMDPRQGGEAAYNSWVVTVVKYAAPQSLPALKAFSLSAPWHWEKCCFSKKITEVHSRHYFQKTVFERIVFLSVHTHYFKI